MSEDDGRSTSSPEFDESIAGGTAITDRLPSTGSSSMESNPSFGSKPAPEYVESPSYRKQSVTPAANTAGAGPAAGSEIAGQPASDRSADHQRELAALTGLTPLGPDVVDQQPQKDGASPGRRRSAAGESASGADGAQRQRRPRTEEEKQAYKEAKLKERKAKELQEDLRIGVKKAYLLIIPVSICMACVIICLKILENPDDLSKKKTSFGYTPYEDPGEEQSSSDKLTGAALNALILLCIIVCLTFGLVICYKNEWYKAIHGWLIMSTVFLVYYFAYDFILNLLWALNGTMSWPSLGLTVYNFGTAGMFAIHWKAPLVVQQFYLIAVSVLMSMVFIEYLPDWTTWIVLGLMAVYDLVAVLCPFGPLRMLVETAQERDQQLFPALIYSSGMVWLINMADVSPSSKNAKPKENTSENGKALQEDLLANGPTTIVQTEPEGKRKPALVHGKPTDDGVGVSVEDDEDDTGVKLGLGDFIFYSILVGKASQEAPWSVVIACYVCIVVGLVMTIFILCIMQKALPALPFSIFIALTFYFSINPTIIPLTDHFAEHMIMV